MSIVSENTDIDPDNETDEPEQAFRGADELEWKGTKLHRFSFVRKTAAIALGLRCWKLTPADFETLENPKFTRLKLARERLEKLKEGEVIHGSIGAIAYAFQEDINALQAVVTELEKQVEGESEEIQIYDAMGQDAAIVLWLCHQPDSTCQRARRKPREYEAQIDKWSEANGIFEGPMAQVNDEALGLFFQIVNEVAVSTGNPELGNSDHDPN